MTIENTTDCDYCRTRFNEGDDVFCYNCYTSLEQEITRLEESLEQEITRLEETISELQDEIVTLEEKNEILF